MTFLLFRQASFSNDSCGCRLRDVRILDTTQTLSSHNWNRNLHWLSLSIPYSLKVLKVHIYYSLRGNSISVCTIEHTIVRFMILRQICWLSIIKSKTRIWGSLVLKPVTTQWQIRIFFTYWHSSVVRSFVRSFVPLYEQVKPFHLWGPHKAILLCINQSISPRGLHH